jgi:hypothetical protein
MYTVPYPLHDHVSGTDRITGVRLDMVDFRNWNRSVLLHKGESNSLVERVWNKTKENQLGQTNLGQKAVGESVLSEFCIVVNWTSGETGDDI